MRLTLTVLGTEVLALEIGRPPEPLPDQVYLHESRHNGDFTLGFTPPPSSSPLPGDVEARSTR